MSTRGAKSAATWQPSCQIVYKESGSGRRFLDPSPTLSHHQTIWWQRKINYISVFRKWTCFFLFLCSYFPKNNKVLSSNFYFKKGGILCRLSRQKIQQLVFYACLLCFLQKVLGPLLKLPETVLTICTSDVSIHISLFYPFIFFS